MKEDKLKVLYIDIENSRMIVEFPTYSLYNIDRIDPKYIKHDWHITCAAWAWLDLEKEKVGKVESVKVSDFASFKKNVRDDRGVVKKIHKVMSDADIIVGHNSDSFDIKKANYKFIKYGLDPIEPVPTVDTLKAARKYARSTSNSLYYLAKELGVPMKVDLGKGVMWKADEGCEKSLKKLERYNKGDIISGAELYFKLRPYIKNHPNINRIMGKQKKPHPKEITHCGSCGSDDIVRNGYRATKIGKRQRYLCYNCGSSTVGDKIK